jgi:hypothetical protein
LAADAAANPFLLIAVREYGNIFLLNY